jgi:hypothetical protein
MKRLVKLLQMVRRGLGGHADARMSMNTYNIRYSAEEEDQISGRYQGSALACGRRIRALAQRERAEISAG